MAPKQNLPFYYRWSLSLSIAFDYPQKKKYYKSLGIQNHFHRIITRCYMPLQTPHQWQWQYAFVMRWDERGMNLRSWTERGGFLRVCVRAALLTVLWAFVPASPQISLNVPHGICFRICVRASLFWQTAAWKHGDVLLVFFLPSFSFSFVFCSPPFYFYFQRRHKSISRMKVRADFLDFSLY